MLAEPSKDTPPSVLAVVSVAAEPVVFWLPAALTPGKFMLAEPSNDTPPRVLALARVVAVDAFPVKPPTNAVLVILVAPVTTPASTTTAPSRTICCPDNGVIVKSVPAVEEISLPFIVILSTERVVKVPKEVIAD